MCGVAQQKRLVQGELVQRERERGGKGEAEGRGRLSTWCWRWLGRKVGIEVMTDHGIKQPKEGVARFWLSFTTGSRSERVKKIK